LRGLARNRDLAIGLADEIDPAQRLGELQARGAREPKVLSGRVPGAQMTLSDGATECRTGDTAECRRFASCEDLFLALCQFLLLQTVSA
jgi:hypothetical protein